MESAGIVATQPRIGAFEKSRTICLAALTATTLIASHQAAASVDQETLAREASTENWPAWGGSFSEQRFSALDQINKDTVSDLGLAWSLELPDMWNVSTAPIAVDGVIYFAAGFSVVHAVDALTGKLLWKHDPELRGRKMRMAWGSRGLTYWKGRVYTGVQDGRLFALDAKTGELVWETQTTDPDDNRYITGAPRAFNDKIIIGHGGGDFAGTRAYVTAYDANTGEQAWRWFVVPGNPADGFEDASMEMAAKTWTGEWWKIGGGGAVWNSMTYDPEFNRVYLGTGNGSPWNRKLRSPEGGDNLFLCSVVALDADTGEYVWHYQTTPGETWDFNSSMDMVLADMDIDGESRKVMMHAPKNGFFYVLDREDGRVISAEKLGKVTWAEKVDLETGRPVEVPGVRYEDGEALMWPGPGGIHNWHPMSYSPDTGLVYIPAREMAGYYTDVGITPKNWSVDLHGPLGVIAFLDDVPKEAGSSSLLAWDPIKQKKVWSVPTPGVINGGLMSTRGGLVFQGRADGRFVANDVDSGDELWSANMGVGTQAPPITFTVGDKQYVSILAGWGGSQNLMGSLSAQHGWVGRKYPRRLLTYVIGGDAQLPPSPAPSRPEPLAAPDFQVDEQKAEKGKFVYANNCLICHGLAAVAGGTAPDLRASPVTLSGEAFKSIVHDGALIPRGMPEFSNLDDENLEQLRHYVRQQAEFEPSLSSQLATVWNFIKLMIKMKLKAWGWI